MNYFLFESEDYFDDLISNYLRDTKLPFHIVKGLIAVESEFDKFSYCYESHLKDASFGLMQVLSRTASGMGYKIQFPVLPEPNKNEPLFEPDLNIKYGIKFLEIMFAKYQNIIDMIASFNMGHPHPAFGKCPYKCKLGDGQTKIQATAYGTAQQDWKYANEPYVKRVWAYSLFYKYKWSDIDRGKLLLEYLPRKKKMIEFVKSPLWESYLIS